MKLFWAIAFCFSSIVSVAQTNEELQDVLLKAFTNPDSTAYFYDQAKLLIDTDADQASFDYFKVFTKSNKNQADSLGLYAEKALQYYTQTDSFNKQRKIYERLYYFALNRGEYDQAMAAIQNALDAATKQKDTAYMSLHLTDKSNLYHDFQDYKTGVEYGKKAYDILAESNNPITKYLIFANNVIAINFDDWNKPDSALYYHYKNIKLIENLEDDTRYSFVYNNIGNTNLKVENYDEADKYIKRALDINLKSGDPYRLATNYTNLATIAFKANNYSKAQSYFKLAQEQANKHGSIEKKRDILQQQAWMYEQKGDFQNAFLKQQAFNVLKDSVFKTERAKIVDELETKYETEKKERALATTRASLVESELKSQQKNLWIYGSLGLALLLGLLGYLFYNQQKLKNHQLRKEAELKSALVKIETQNKLQEQRLRISRDLHDNIGAQLTFIISSMDNLKYAFPKMTKAMADKISGISTFTGQTIYELRDTIWAMNKEDISFEDLQGRISNFINKAQNVRTQTSFNFSIEDGINPEHEFTSVHGMNIYRIIQEAVNNALKYAQADNISVHISQTSSAYTIRVVDDGKGFDATQADLGNGQNNIRKRANILKAQVDLESKIGKGTSLTLTLPK